MPNPDKDLLERAARAAGIEWSHEECGTLYLVDPLRPWDPLNDDGDAMRLAVKLNITPMHVARNDIGGDAFVNATAYDAQDNLVDIYEDHGDDPYAATRRAIVRAAASLCQGGEGQA